VFPGGRHSRLEHSVLVYDFNEHLDLELIRRNMITRDDRANLRAACALHDIGHPPFSHALEFILGSLLNPGQPVTNGQMSVKYIEQSDSLQHAINDSGADVDRVKSIIAKTDPLSVILSHHTLGVDKVGYLVLDTHHTGHTHSPSLPFFLDLFPHYVFREGVLGIDQSKSEQVRHVQHLSQTMYTNVYFNPDVSFYKRLIQKAVELHAENSDLGELWELAEGTVLHYLQHSENSAVRDLTEGYDTPNKYVCVLRFKMEGFSGVDDRTGKVVEIDEATLKQLVKLPHNPPAITVVENELCCDAGLDPQDAFLAISGDPYRTIPGDVSLYNNGDQATTLSTQFPAHYASLQERANSAFTAELYVKADKVDSINIREASDLLLQAIETRC